MKKVLLTTPCAPYDLGWGEDTMDLLASRLARGHDIAALKSDLPTWGLYLIAENIRHPSMVLEYPHWDEFLRELSGGYDVIGIQLKTLNLERTVRMVEAIKKYSPRSEIVIGGYGVSALYDPLPGDVNEYGRWLRENAHHLCREEGVRFMRRLLGDEPVDRPITQFHMPYANFHLPGVRRFDLNIPAILVALGCPSACDFCNTSAFFKHKKIYVSDPAETHATMLHHVQKLGAESLNVILFDEDIFLNPEYVRELGRLIRADRRTWGVRWISFGSVRALASFTAEELRECGVGGIWIGVESGLVDGQCAKEGFGKRDGGKSPPELFDELHRHGIETIGSMILGFDFHSPENIEQDIDYFVKLKPLFYQIGPLTPCPGTKLYRDFMRDGRVAPTYSYQHFHLWKDDGIDYANFREGELKKYFDLTHERLRTENGPPTLQFCEVNLRAYETFVDHPSEFLRFQAEQAKTLALGALPLVRAIAKHPPSPEVQRRARAIEAQADKLLGRPSLPMRVASKAVEMIALAQAELRDPLEKKPVVSDPGLRLSRYDGKGGAPDRSGNFGRADKRKVNVARAGNGRPDKQRVDPRPAEKVRVEGDLAHEEATETKKKKKLAVVG